MDISRLAQKLREADFGPDESVIASSIMHPIEAAKRGAEWFGGQVNRAANIPDQFDNPNPTRGYTPEQQLEAGLNLAGMAQTGALPMAPATRGGTLGSIAVSHGSPHKFEKFDFTKIGTGEGAQAYGHGGYFAEGFDSPVAREYRDTLSDAKFVGASGKDLRKMPSVGSWGPLLNEMKRSGKQDSEIIDFLRTMSDKYKDNYGKTAGNLADKLEKGTVKYKTGNLYNVSLEWPDAAREAADPMGPHHFLDWDAPLIKQSKKIKETLKKDQPLLFRNTRYSDALTAGSYLNSQGISGPEAMKGWNAAYRYGVPAEDMTGQDYWHLAMRLSDNNGEKASKLLADLGIPGIRYLDQGSRGAGQGTSNYVVFDDEIPKIISRNGVELARLLREK